MRAFFGRLIDITDNKYATTWDTLLKNSGYDRPKYNIVNNTIKVEISGGKFVSLIPVYVNELNMVILALNIAQSSVETKFQIGQMFFIINYTENILHADFVSYVAFAVQNLIMTEEVFNDIRKTT